MGDLCLLKGKCARCCGRMGAEKNHKKNDKKIQKVSLDFYVNSPYNENAKWLEVVENGAKSHENGGEVHDR